jgi:hypothetical protein
MSDHEKKREDKRDASDFRTLFGYSLADAWVTYNLREVAGGGSEVWVNEEAGDTVNTIDRRTFDTPDECMTWLMDEEKRLTDAGWTRRDARPSA